VQIATPFDVRGPAAIVIGATMVIDGDRQPGSAD